MAKYFILVGLVCLFTGSAVNSRDMDEPLGDRDKRLEEYILNHCGEACNGEGPNCQECYSRAVDLSDQENPDSPEVDFDLDYDSGKLDLTF